ncbi:non-ribosomal peptide synthetase [Amycolatopsis keratiniphila]|uniref:non-ribosomal peptide synthetase n=1 Tax=Amycolatopsis keratiniphila TaxID=129921 RepID=UPI0008794A31|nr:non-ribosomal peptide synthetase [Amycolatopsis keratiniphila]OLZ52700.1 hypothetical protein BS330_22670 [Amycolatopsis keratiniphila subsp. nogabecina]SDU09904.1 amino acid adenylation domain-containing protein [Amycolatopsis keratiniphila]
MTAEPRDVIDRVRELPPDRRALLRQRIWESGRATGLSGADENGQAPASFTQRRMVFLHQLVPGSAAYNSPVAYRLTGDVDIAALEGALNDVVARHEALRTTLTVNEGRVVQQVSPAVRLSLPVTDLSELPGPDRDAAYDRIARDDQARSFDLAAGPMLRPRLLRFSARDAVLLITFHHAVVDGWSLSLFVRELGEHYTVRRGGTPERLPELTVTYAEYARWQQDWVATDEARRQLEHWQRELADAPASSTLPADRPRPATPSHQGAVHGFTVTPALTGRLADLAQNREATLFMVLLAAYQVVLSRYSGQPEVCVGTPVANRRYRGFRELIGFFANSVVLRTRLDERQGFDELLSQVRATCLAAFDHQDIPLDLVAQRLHPDRDPSRNPLYQANFTLHNTPQSVATMPGVELTELVVDHDGARFDLDLNVTRTEAGLECRLGYATDLFDSGTAARFARSFQVLLEAVAANAATPVGALPVLDAAESARLARLWSRPTPAPSGTACVHERFARQAAATPTATAVSAATGPALTYRLLDRRANGLARHLRELGVRRGDPVAVLMSRSPHAIVALLGVLKAGAAYVPMDPAHPDAALAHVYQDCGARLLVTERGLAGRARTLGSEVVLADEIAQEAAAPPSTGVRPGDTLYVIYTSGTTGRPKGTVLTHASVDGYLRWAGEAYLPAGSGDTVPVHSSLGVDLTVTSLFAPLLTGRELVLLEESDIPGEALRASAAADKDFAFVKLTPSHLRLLESAGAAGRDDVWARTLVIGGEALHEDHVAAWRRGGAAGRLVNEYGPTETAVACAAHELGEDLPPSGRIPIGRPLPGARLYVLDGYLRPVPVGAPGELYVGGTGVARGYVNAPGRTAERFVADPFVAGAVVYRTGDIVRHLADGALEYLGRGDDQLKIRGHRVEPAEVEALLESHDRVRRAVVLPEGDGDDLRLAAVVVTEPGAGTHQHRTEDWLSVYEDTYAALEAGPDATFNLAGWTSSYTGEPLDPAEMLAWLAGTVDRITGLGPRRVLEIGCGTGLLLFRVASGCESYRAIDFSPAAVEYVRRSVAGTGLEDVTDLAAVPAHLAVRPGDRFDTVVLNSVVQYFPSVGYLIEVLDSVVATMEDGGHVFLGDLRDLTLLETFHTSVVAHRADPATPLSRIRAEIRREVEAEEELCVDPRLFAGIARRSSRITSVRVLRKPPGYDNELSRYRYDVILTVGGDRSELSPAVPPATSGRDSALRALLEDAPSTATLADLLGDLDRNPTPAERGETTAAPDDIGFPARYANDPRWHAEAVTCRPDLEALAREHLPAALRPSRYVFVPSLPLTVTGKLDRAALRARLAADRDIDGEPAGGARERPMTSTEQRVAVIWAELLRRDGIRPSDDFFDLGGHSLLTFQLVFRLRKEFGVEVPIRAPFDASTVEAQAALVDERLREIPGPVRPELVPVPRTGPVPASFAQERLWFLNQLEPDSVQYNFPVFLRLRGCLDVGFLREAVNEVVARHEVLRTVLVPREGRPFQTVLPAEPLDVPLVDLSGMDAAAREDEAALLAARQYSAPFDLARPPVVRTGLLRLSDTEHILLLTVHHLSVDGWAAGLLRDELAESYTARVENRRPRLPELTVQYADYAVWQRRLLDEGHQDDLREYWRGRLEGILDLPRLPMDHERPRDPAHHGRTLDLRLPAATADALRVLCKAEECTLFMALLAPLFALVGRRAGATDVVVGTDVANRSATPTEPLIGFFVNQIVLRADLAGGPTWRELLRRTRTLTLDAFAHQDLPFEEVVKAVKPPRSRNQSPLFQVKFVLNTTRRSESVIPGIEVTDYRPPVIATSRFDLVVLLEEGPEGITGLWEYDTELFTEKTMAAMRREYLDAIENLVRSTDAPLTSARARRPRAELRPPAALREAPAKITVSARDAVVEQPLSEHTRLPLLVRPAGEEIDLVEWARESRDRLQAVLLDHGALLFRGFGVTEPARLEQFASVFVDELFAENGEHPRAKVGGGGVYTPVFFPPEKKLLWHNENSFNDVGPAKIWFCCARPAETGGETPVVDSREVYRRLDPALREEFARKKVRYVRQYGSGLGLHWREVFRTADRAEVEARCVEQGLEWEWHGERLRTAAVRPAVVRHPVTGEWSWFNQAQHWHIACLDETTRTSLLDTVGEGGLPRECRFGDGTPIPDSAMTEICAVYDELEIVFPWQRGDVLMLDNILVAHARNPFQGERELLVAMGEMVRFR